MTAAPRSDLATIAAIAVVAYAIANFTHEGIGHGGTCLLTACEPVLLTSMSLHSEHADASTTSHLVAAGGSTANLLLGVLALLLLRRTPAAAQARWFFLWLLATINLLQAAGYLLFSGLGNVGDWATIARELPHPGLWRIGLAITGGTAYWFITDAMIKRLGARLPGSGQQRLPAAYRHTLTAWLAGAALYSTAALLDPWGIVMLFVSALPASLGGTSGLAWGPQLLRNPNAGAYAGEELRIARDARWLAAALVVAAAFVFVLGPGVALR